MPKKIVPLGELQVKNAKATMFDGGGLYLLVTPSGGKLWRFKYRFAGKPKLLSFGSYPEVSLQEARRRRDEARSLVANNTDPSDVRKNLQAAIVATTENAFEVVAREWYGKFAPTWSDSYAYWVRRRLEQSVFPVIGARPIAELKALDILNVLRKIETVTLETAHRVKFIIGQIFRYAVGSGRAERDLTVDLKGQLPARSKRHHAAITDPKELAGLLRAIDGFKGTYIVKCALQLSPLVFLRPGELRQAEWSEFDLEAAEWNIPIERLKLKKRIKEERKGEKHLVPLSRQAVEILKGIQQLTGSGRYVFPCARSVARPMSNNAVNGAIHRMGFDNDEMTAHGFRATARTILSDVEELGFSDDIIEHQLAHAVRDANGRAYNRTTKLPQRRKMMQQWADYLDDIKAVAKVIPIRGGL
ncbi:MAG: integrase arm-type DNA-binding domain-containing protein [Desulfuromonadales bacterium]